MVKARALLPIYTGALSVKRGFVRRFLEAEAFKLAIKRRASDLQPARDLRHLLAIMRDGKADDFALDILERAHIALRVEQPQRSRG